MIRKILLIDDDEDEMEILVGAFRQIEHQPEWMYEKSPENAIEVLKRFSPDFLFLDYNMPKINGLVCLAQIRSVPLLNHVNIVMYSSSIPEDVQMKATELGAIACIEKTYSMGELVTRIEKIIRVSKAV